MLLPPPKNIKEPILGHPYILQGHGIVTFASVVPGFVLHQSMFVSFLKRFMKLFAL